MWCFNLYLTLPCYNGTWANEYSMTGGDDKDKNKHQAKPADKTPAPVDKGDEVKVNVPDGIDPANKTAEFIKNYDKTIEYLRSLHLPGFTGDGEPHKNNIGPLKFNEVGGSLKSEGTYIFTSGVTLKHLGDGFNLQGSGSRYSFLNTGTSGHYGDLQALNTSTKIDAGLSYTLKDDGGFSYSSGLNASYIHNRVLIDTNNNGHNSALNNISYNGANFGGMVAVQRDFDNDHGTAYLRGNITFPMLMAHTQGNLQNYQGYNQSGSYTIDRNGSASLTLGIRHSVENYNNPIADVGLFISASKQLGNFDVSTSDKGGHVTLNESFKPASDISIGVSLRLRNGQKGKDIHGK